MLRAGIDNQKKISMLSSADLLCSLGKIVEEYLKRKPCHRLHFQDYNSQPTARLKTTHFTHMVFSTHSCHPDRCAAPSVRPYAWKEAWSLLPWALMDRWKLAINLGESSPSIPDAWNYICKFWSVLPLLAFAGLFKRAFSHCFSKDLPKNVSIQTTITQNSSRGAKNNSTQGSKFNSNFKDFSCQS